MLTGVRRLDVVGIGIYGYAITASAVGCVLLNTGNVLYYDRKYSIPGKGREEFTHYEP
jgi:hypothetical protein